MEPSSLNNFSEAYARNIHANIVEIGAVILEDIRFKLNVDDALTHGQRTPIRDARMPFNSLPCALRAQLS